MSQPDGYRLLDEPQPGAMAQLVVDPLWPLLAVMFGGAWLSWPWFALNGFAVGSPTRRRELAWAVGGFAGSAALVVALGVLTGRGILAGVGIQYALVGLTVWKLLVSYRLYLLQARSFGLYRYFGGAVRNGFLVILVAFIFGPRLLADLPEILLVILR
ncbi:MAG: hypothetical protein AAGN66_00185 [Acidobacteriota bacterium]